MERPIIFLDSTISLQEILVKPYKLNRLDLVASAKFIQADEFITFDRRLRQIKDLKVKVLHREREK